MKVLRQIAGCLAVILLTAGHCLAENYIGGGNAIPLKVDSAMVTIKFDDTFSIAARDSLLADIDRIIGVDTNDITIDGFLACSLSTGEGYYAFVDSVEAIDGVYLVEPFYLNSLDSALLVGTGLCVAFEENMSQLQIDSINAIYGTVVDREVDGMPNVFVLRNTDSSGYHVLELANAYYTLSETRYSHPDFAVTIQISEYRLYDFYNEYQPHIKNVIGLFNEASVWDFGGLADVITVAIIDDGVESHEDLPASRVLPGRDFSGLIPDDDPRPGSGRAHGMGSAGIIGASHSTDIIEGSNSSSGMISLNPNTLIIPVKIFDDFGKSPFITPTKLADAIIFAYTNGADVISNSWNTASSGDKYDIIEDAINDATTLGRGGLGCPVIFAAGNTAGGADPGIQFPASVPSAFAVGATQLDVDETRWWYSSFGVELDIVAPSGQINHKGDFWTLDRMGTSGVNPMIIAGCIPPVPPDPIGSNDVDYDCRFGGTSAACPVVSGVASLILARDPTLTYDKVYDILRNSAVKDVGPGPGPITPPDLEYGYGRVDAFRAVLSIARGDLDADPNGTVDITDLTVLIDHLFLSLAPLKPTNMVGNIDCDPFGHVDITDLTLLIDHLFLSLKELPIPCFNYVSPN